jgi:DNA-directed RNA polymerase alpha subunit
MTRTDHYIAAALTGLLAQNRSYTDFELLDTSTRLGVRLNSLAEERDSLKEHRFNATRDIKDCEVSIRCANSLAYKGLRTLAELAKCSRNDLLSIPNFGNRSLKEVIWALSSAGLKLRE